MNGRALADAGRTIEAHVATRRPNLYRLAVAAVEKPLIEMVIGLANGNKCEAARILGINRNTLHAKMRAHGIAARRVRPRRRT